MSYESLHWSQAQPGYYGECVCKYIRVFLLSIVQKLHLVLVLEQCMNIRANEVWETAKNMFEEHILSTPS
jgi:hypothetical protein